MTPRKNPNSVCADCGWTVRYPREYHPFVACIIVKATGRDPLSYLRIPVAPEDRINEPEQCGCELPVEAAIHWPGMVPQSHPFGAIPVGEEPTDGHD